MKKFIAIMLILVYTVSFAGCGEVPVDDQIDTDEYNETMSEMVVETEQTGMPAIDTEAETETIPVEEETEPETAFDTSWAANEFEALLPELPLTGWVTKQESDTVYEMELGGLQDQVITDENGNTIGYGEDKASLIAYLESLREYGFTVEETGGIEGYMYEWEVTDTSGNEIKVVCAEGYCWITITKK